MIFKNTLEGMHPAMNHPLPNFLHLSRFCRLILAPDKLAGSRPHPTCRGLSCSTKISLCRRSAFREQGLSLGRGVVWPQFICPKPCRLDAGLAASRNLLLAQQSSTCLRRDDSTATRKKKHLYSRKQMHGFQPHQRNHPPVFP